MNLSFKNVSIRTKDYLKEYSQRNSTKLVRRTHQAIANELGTTRVVVSRILKNLENTGFVELGRGLIKIKNF
jgi:CRP/FNR family transcriptional regulator, anaerobic regulatory protein